MSVLPTISIVGLAARGPALTSVRTAARINIQKPKLPHWEKARFQKLTIPKLPQPKDLLSEHRGCFHAVETRLEKQVNPLEVLLASKLWEACRTAQLIVFFHRNSVSMTEIHKTWQTLKRAGFTYHKLFNNVIARHAFTDTHLEPALTLCCSHTSLVTCEEPKVAQLLRLQKKMPQLLVIGGVVQGRLMSLSDMEEYAKLPSMATLHAQLSHLLSSPAAGVSASLNHHQTALVRSLAAYGGAAADVSADGETAPSSKSEDES